MNHKGHDLYKPGAYRRHMLKADMKETNLSFPRGPEGTVCTMPRRSFRHGKNGRNQIVRKAMTDRLDRGT